MCEERGKAKPDSSWHHFMVLEKAKATEHPAWHICSLFSNMVWRISHQCHKQTALLSITSLPLTLSEKSWSKINFFSVKLLPIRLQ